MFGKITFALGKYLIGGGFQTLADAYKAKLAAGNTSENIAAGLAARELAVEQREAELNVQYKTALIGHWYEPVQLLAYIMVVYVGKVIIWDKVLGYFTNGNTDPIGGDVGAWAGMIIMFLVGKRAGENWLHIIRGR